MVSGLLPVVGVPLPLVSYGGTSVVTLLAGFGILMALYSHRKISKLVVTSPRTCLVILLLLLVAPASARHKPVQQPKFDLKRLKSSRS